VPYPTVSTAFIARSGARVESITANYGCLRKFSEVDGRGRVKYVILGLRRQLCCQAVGKSVIAKSLFRQMQLDTCTFVQKRKTIPKNVNRFPSKHSLQSSVQSANMIGCIKPFSEIIQ
jgi:hypothetical protein